MTQISIKIFEKAKRRDAIATWVIRAGGCMVILCVVLMLLLIAKVAVPLFYSPSATLLSKFSLKSSKNVLATGLDELLETAFVFEKSGKIAFWNLASKSKVEELPISPPQSMLPGSSSPDLGSISQIKPLGSHRYALLWKEGSITVEEVRFLPKYDENGKRHFNHAVGRLATLPAPSKETPLDYAVSLSQEGMFITTYLWKGGRITVHWQNSVTDFLGNQKLEETQSGIQENIQEEIATLALSHAGHFYAGTKQGSVWHWDLSEPGVPTFVERTPISEEGRGVSGLNFILGENSLAVGENSGRVSVWSFVASESEKRFSLTLLHETPGHDNPIMDLLPSARSRSLVSLDKKGEIRISHVTSERALGVFQGDQPFVHMAFSMRDNGLFAIDREGACFAWKLSIPHPETSFRTLFGKVWYEGYPKPEFVWQSTAGTDEFEPKLSLSPLLFGSLKGTFYAMLFAAPIALMGAVYVSQFASQRVKKIIKPTLEIMAAVPSVVIGFLAALWFAPFLERSLIGFFMCFALIPLFLIVFLLFWPTVSKHEWIKKHCKGMEWVWVIPLLVMVFLVAYQWSPWIEGHCFKGNVQQWIFEHWGVRYDQRNSIIIAFALGFAVIPIIFTISEDALSNVPSSLKAASYALGASRWQTVWRVILPSSSPGIFAGLMIGFGRAVGETMIVLMATGNTPIMDLSPFNGMRTLSANIAVEMPEAPFGGTLYRVLFLSAVLLFVLTFLLNTGAEVIRQRLRKKYARF